MEEFDIFNLNNNESNDLNNIKEKMNKLKENELFQNDNLKFEDNNQIYNTIKAIQDDILLIIRDIYKLKYNDLFNFLNDKFLYIKAIEEIENTNNIKNIKFKFISDKNIRFSILTGLKFIKIDILDNNKTNILKELCSFYKDNYNKLNDIIKSSKLQIKFICPNLVNLIGEDITLKLIIETKNLDNLSFTPSCDIKCIGRYNYNKLGLNNIDFKKFGLLYELQFIQNSPEKYQNKLIKMFSSGISKCSKYDLSKCFPNGEKGIETLKEILNKFDKIQEPVFCEDHKGLPIPEIKTKKSRGGKRMRKLKEKRGYTKLNKMKQTVKFGPEAQVEDMETGKGYGLINKEGSNILYKKIKKEKINLTKKQDKYLQNKDKIGTQSKIIFKTNDNFDLKNLINLNKNDNSLYESNKGFETVLKEKKLL